MNRAEGNWAFLANGVILNRSPLYFNDLKLFEDQCFDSGRFLENCAGMRVFLQNFNVFGDFFGVCDFAKILR